MRNIFLRTVHKQSLYRFILLSFILNTWIQETCAQPPAPAIKKKDSLVHAVKLDLLASYFMFFNSRIQYRLGVEYEKRKKNKTACILLDAGLYDHYEFKKYYDFFNQGPGLYSVNQKVKTYGFHMQPSYRYDVMVSTRRPGRSVFAGGVADLSIYCKKISTSDSRKQGEVKDRYYQGRVGIGPVAGVRYPIYKRCFLEFCTGLPVRLFFIKTGRSQAPIIAQNAQWNHTDLTLWWFNQLKIAYAF